jgi:putative redox protein
MVTGKRSTGLVATMAAKTHELISGVSEKLGGHDEGADPHELLEAALTACTIITAQLYANRKGIKLESADVTVKIVSEGPATVISREVSFRGDLTEDQRTRLGEIVNKCPIHRLLESNVKIETTIQP